MRKREEMGGSGREREETEEVEEWRNGEMEKKWRLSYKVLEANNRFSSVVR